MNSLILSRCKPLAQSGGVTSDKSWKLQFYFANLFGILGNAGGGFHDEAWLSLGSSHCQTDERAVRVLALRLRDRGP